MQNTASPEALYDAWSPGRRAPAGPVEPQPDHREAPPKLVEIGDERIRRMDDMGVDVQVTSVSTAGVQALDSGDAIPLARRFNETIAGAIRAHPDRFGGWATLAMQSPQQAAAELERAVTQLGLSGAMTYGRLGVPLYMHPRAPAKSVSEAYYDGFDQTVAGQSATAGIGWHCEDGLQLLRMILAGGFDEYPDLQVIVGHRGEIALFYLERVVRTSASSGLKHDISDYFRRNVYVTPSGIFSDRHLRWAMEVIGPDRIMFAVDDPYIPAPDGKARRFLENAARAKIAHGNWQRLTAR